VIRKKIISDPGSRGSKKGRMRNTAQGPRWGLTDEKTESKISLVTVSLKKEKSKVYE
jgi:hypothetical protein